MHDIIPFCFEFHSFLPLSAAKTYHEALSTSTVQLFGRTSNGESVSLNVLGVCPYFYIQIEGDDTMEGVSVAIFGGEDALNASGLNSSQFALSKVHKVAFYQFQVQGCAFVKIECCNEGVRKRLLDFVKINNHLNLKIFEGHISFMLQFMSDFGIVGMGNVILDRFSRVSKDQVTTQCDLELVAHHENIVNNLLAQPQAESSNRPLLSTLSIFLDSLGVNHLPQKKLAKMKHNEAETESMYSLWGEADEVKEHLNSRITDPSFRNYTYRYPPPVIDCNYYREPQQEVRQCTELPVHGLRSNRLCYYTPNIDPPLLDPDLKSKEQILKSVPREEVIERLSLNTKTAPSNLIYNFNGDFFLKIMTLECFACPRLDSIIAIAITLIYREVTVTYLLKSDSIPFSSNLKLKDCDYVKSFSSERDLIESMIELLVREDPDVLSGFDVDNYSWGLVARRFTVLLPEVNFDGVIGRLKSRKRYNVDPWIAKASSHFQVSGRIVINLWRIHRDEVALRLYTAANVANHYFNSFCPEYNPEDLYSLISNAPIEFLKYCCRVVEQSVSLTIRTPFLVKAIEFSRLFGIDLFSTLIRGSQYRVESIMIRAAHSEGYLLRTPYEDDVNGMRAAQGLPLVMEPESQFYRDPVVVLDFQSLYPSLVIAYNYCYSTVIGSHQNEQLTSCGFIHQPSFSDYGLESKEHLFSFDLFEAPENILFVQRSAKVGLLPRLLDEILRARLIIKSAMKSCDPKLKSVMDARQLALKYISNVTYGYTSASFSGRMPNVDIADAIVLSGRRTLERAVNFIESTTQWAAKVVYGDTDSLFILLPGRSREEAFKLGKEMAEAVTALNPDPVTLKFEKVYHPCVLMTKKRYCGYKFESLLGAPTFDAKGIETVRRDGCPLAAKILEKSLRLLFTSHDVEFIKIYVQRQMIKILSYKKLNLADFVFAREVRFGSYKSEQESRLPLSAIAAKQAQARNPSLLIPYGQRVPFLIVTRPFSQLYQQVLHLGEFIRASPAQRIDAVYYVTKQIIPVLSRSLLVDGIDVFKWYNELPLTALRYACHANKTISIFGGSIIDSSTSLHQQSQLLQDLMVTEQRLRRAHKHSCGCFEACQAACCKAFWSYFSFHHLHGQVLDALFKQFFDCAM